MTSDMITSRSGDLDSIHFRSQGEAGDGDGSLPDWNPTSSIRADDEAPGEPGVGRRMQSKNLYYERA